jgi:hypothetical protein
MQFGELKERALLADLLLLYAVEEQRSVPVCCGHISPSRLLAAASARSRTEH